VAQQLRKKGITRVHPLAGGFNGWKELGFPLQEAFPEAAAAGKA
jgi:rhodanese-related sulfurtransferase